MVVMKLLVFILALLCLLQRLALGVVPPVMDVTLACDPRPAGEQVVAYRFYELVGTNWMLSGSVGTNLLKLTNVNVLIRHTYGVAASNVFGESDLSAPYVTPNSPKPPSGLGVIQTSLVTPLPSIIEGTTDLLAWNETQRFTILSNGLLTVTFRTDPRDRVQFWRTKSTLAPLLPPLP